MSAAGVPAAAAADSSAAAAAASISANATTTGLTKAERGRLKKLRRRAALPTDDDGSSSSQSASNNTAGGGGIKTGITTRDDFIELKDLLDRKGEGACVPGPSVLVSSRPVWTEDNCTSPERWQHTSGADHRDIITSLLFHDGSNSAGGQKDQKQSKKKRKREHSGNGDGAERNVSSSSKSQTRSFVPPLPSWARLHNPACADGLVVVEFSIEASSSSSSVSDTMPSKRIAASDDDDSAICKLLSKDGLRGRRATPFTTRLFQGDRPRHVTDVLMYLDIPQQQQQSDNDANANTASAAENGATQNDIQTMTSLLKPYVLARKDRRKERYPCQKLEKKRGTPRKRKRHRMSQEEIAEEARLASRKAAEDAVMTIAANFPPVIQNITPPPDESTNGDDNIFSNAFTKDEAIDLVKRLEVSILGQDDCADGEVFIPTFPSRPIDASNAAAANSAQTTSSPSIFAMDCEMVETSAGRELARVTLVQFEPTEQNPDGYRVVLDVLVKPTRHVLDYKTQYSGITASMLEPINTRIEEVQIAVSGIVKAEDILIGHSLENDLRALCLVHDVVVDTAMIFRTDNGSRKHALKHLSAVLLKKRIQAGCGSSGHCSEEDAAAALILALNRGRIGPSFKVYERPEPKNIIEEVTTIRRKNSIVMKDNASSISEIEAPIVVLGPDDWLRKHVTSHKSSAHALRCESISSASSGALVAWLVSEKRKANLLWANLTVDKCDTKKANQLVDDVMTDIVRQASSRTAILFTFQTGFERALNITRQRKSASDLRSTLGWSPEQEEEWKQSVGACATSEALWVGNKSG